MTAKEIESLKTNVKCYSNDENFMTMIYLHGLFELDLPM